MVPVTTTAIIIKTGKNHCPVFRKYFYSLHIDLLFKYRVARLHEETELNSKLNTVRP